MSFQVLGILQCNTCDEKVQTTAEIDLEYIPQYYESPPRTEVLVTPDLPDGWQASGYKNTRHICPKCLEKLT